MENLQTKLFDATKTACILLKNASNVITMVPNKEVKNTIDEVTLGLKHNCDILIENGLIKNIEPNIAEMTLPKGSIIIDCSKMVLMPGLIDAHCHPIFMGSRAKETLQKAQGMTYEEIATSGGGISVTTQCTRDARDAELISSFVRNAQTALTKGVVLMEAKTGYGLNPAEEFRHLKCIYNANTSENYPLPTIAPTILGPHAESAEYNNLSDYIQALVDYLPQYAELNQKYMGNKYLNLAADIFIERNYFSPEHGERWLGSALQSGFSVKVHAEEFSHSGGCGTAIALAKQREQSERLSSEQKLSTKVLSVDHCQYATDNDLRSLAQLGIAAVALPTTSFFSGIPFVDANKWRNSGVKIAIATDFNPGSSPINNIWFAAFLALTRCKFSLPEVYAGITCNAAFALNAQDNYGTLTIGKPANVVGFYGNSPHDLIASPTGEHVGLVVFSN